jgi:hypothetical protein
MHSALTATLFLCTPSHGLLFFILNQGTPLSLPSYTLIYRLFSVYSVSLSVQNRGRNGNSIEQKHRHASEQSEGAVSQQTCPVQRVHHTASLRLSFTIWPHSQA